MRRTVQSAITSPIYQTPDISPDKGFTLLVTGHPFKLYKERSYSSVRASYFSVRVINVW